MNNQIKLYGKRTWILLTALLCALAVFMWVMIYRYDNKYTAPGPQAMNGVLLLDEQALESYPVLHLVNGWELYNGKLLTPEDFQQNPPLPDEYIYIGQYGGFETGNADASPHGSASYRLNIIVPDKTQTYMLELPEIFSAYRIYINGTEATGMGNPDPAAYVPATGNKTISFEASGRIQILLAVSDFSHIYSGMVYPPAFGHPEAVAAILNARLIFRSLLCAAALTIGLLAVLIDFLSRKTAMAVLYGLMCLFFVGYTSYPITQTLARDFYPLYAIENFSFCAMFVVVMLLQKKICCLAHRWSYLFIGFGVLVCTASLILPYIVPSGNLYIMTAYSDLITAYKWITASFITLTTLQSIWQNSVQTETLLCGILIFDSALVMDRLLPLHEPIISGWFTELAGFALILSVGVVIAKEVAAEYAKSAVMEERARSMERFSEMQRTYYPLLQDKIEEAKAARHDLHHHFVMISGFLENGQPDKLKEYVSEYGALIREAEPVSYSQNDVANVLAHHYVRLAKKYGINLTLLLDIGAEIKVSDADLCGLLGNLLENAVESCLRQTDGRRFIDLTVKHEKSAIAIHMKNSGNSVVTSQTGFLSSKAKNRKGYGLDSVKTIAQRYKGETEFRYDEEIHMFTSVVLLIAS